MNRLAHAIKSRREYRRTRRALGLASNRAASSGMRDELIWVGQRTDLIR